MLEWDTEAGIDEKKRRHGRGALLYYTSHPQWCQILYMTQWSSYAYIIPKARVVVLYCTLNRYAIHSSLYHGLAGPSLGNYLLSWRFTITWAAIPFLQRLLNENHLDEYLAKTGSQQQWAGAQNHKLVPRK